MNHPPIELFLIFYLKVVFKNIKGPKSANIIKEENQPTQEHIMGFLLQCNDMHLAEKVFLCATVGGEGLTQGELAELYNLLKPPLQVTGKHYTDCSFSSVPLGLIALVSLQMPLEMRCSNQMVFCAKSPKNLRIVWDLSIEPSSG